MTKAPQGLCND